MTCFWSHLPPHTVHTGVAGLLLACADVPDGLHDVVGLSKVSNGLLLTASCLDQLLECPRNIVHFEVGYDALVHVSQKGSCVGWKVDHFH